MSYGECEKNNISNHLLALYVGQPSLSLNTSQALPIFPPRPPSLLLWSNTYENLRKS